MILPDELDALMRAILAAEILDPDTVVSPVDPGPVADQMHARIKRWGLSDRDAATLWRVQSGEPTFSPTVRWASIDAVDLTT